VLGAYWGLAGSWVHGAQARGLKLPPPPLQVFFAAGDLARLHCSWIAEMHGCVIEAETQEVTIRPSNWFCSALALD
jgi:hypothetical protein